MWVCFVIKTMEWKAYNHTICIIFRSASLAFSRLFRLLNAHSIDNEFWIYMISDSDEHTQMRTCSIRNYSSNFARELRWILSFFWGKFLKFGSKNGVLYDCDMRWILFLLTITNWIGPGRQQITNILLHVLSILATWPHAVRHSHDLKIGHEKTWICWFCAIFVRAQWAWSENKSIPIQLVPSLKYLRCKGMAYVVDSHAFTVIACMHFAIVISLQFSHVFKPTNDGIYWILYNAWQCYSTGLSLLLSLSAFVNG